MKANSILEVEILLWYSYSTKDFPNIDTPAVIEAISKFCELGIMERMLIGDKQVSVKQDALDAYVNEILDVSLPKIKWTCKY